MALKSNVVKILMTINQGQEVNENLRIQCRDFFQAIKENQKRFLQNLKISIVQYSIDSRIVINFHQCSLSQILMPVSCGLRFGCTVSKYSFNRL